MKIINELLTTGTWQGIHTGIDLPTFFSLISTPVRAHKDVPVGAIYSSAGAEFFFLDERLVSITLSLEENKDLFIDFPLSKTRRRLSVRTTIDDYINALRRAGIDWFFDKPLSDQKQLCVSTAARACAFFNYQERRRLTKIAVVSSSGGEHSS